MKHRTWKPTVHISQPLKGQFSGSMFNLLVQFQLFVQIQWSLYTVFPSLIWLQEQSCLQDGSVYRGVNERVAEQRVEGKRSVWRRPHRSQDLGVVPRVCVGGLFWVESMQSSCMNRHAHPIQDQPQTMIQWSTSSPRDGHEPFGPTLGMIHHQGFIWRDGVLTAMVKTMVIHWIMGIYMTIFWGMGWPYQKNTEFRP